MKTGKYVNLGSYKNIKIGFGTVDFVDLKTIYIKFNSWVSPNDMDIDFDVEISLTKRKIKLHISNLKNEYFKQFSIVDFDIRTKGIRENKKSFMNLEVTLFVDKHFNLKDKKNKDMIKNICQEIIDNTLTKHDFSFFINKK